MGSSAMWRNIFLSQLLMTFCVISKIDGQDYFFIDVTFHANNVNFDNGLCNCSIEQIGSTMFFEGEISYSPEGILYSLNEPNPGDERIHILDPNTGNVLSTVMIAPGYLPWMIGFVSAGNGIFYSHPSYTLGYDTIYRWDVNLNTVAPIGIGGFIADGAMAMSNGQIYFPVREAIPGMRSIVRWDPADPTNPTILVSYPMVQLITGLTASPYCNILIGVDVYARNFLMINLIDGSIEPICNFNPLEVLW